MRKHYLLTVKMSPTKLELLKTINICDILNPSCQDMIDDSCYDISGLDDTENREIYKTYMHFGQISYSGKLQVLKMLIYVVQSQLI